MTGTSKSPFIWAATAVLGLGTAFAAAGGGQAASTDGPLSCEIVARSSGGTTAIEALAHAERALAGTYSFSVKGPGTDISQGGAFDASAGRAATLGSVMLGGTARAYEVRLEVKAGGRSASCAERIGRAP